MLKILQHFFLFSRMYNQPEVAEWYREKLKLTMQDNLLLHQLFFLSLPWFDNASPKKSGENTCLRNIPQHN